MTDNRRDPGELMNEFLAIVHRLRAPEAAPGMPSRPRRL